MSQNSKCFIFNLFLRQRISLCPSGWTGTMYPKLSFKLMIINRPPVSDLCDQSCKASNLASKQFKNIISSEFHYRHLMLNATSHILKQLFLISTSQQLPRLFFLDFHTKTLQNQVGTEMEHQYNHLYIFLIFFEKQNEEISIKAECLRISLQQLEFNQKCSYY